MLAEVSSFAMITPHCNLLALLDVEVAASATAILVFPLLDGTLSQRILAGGIPQEEVIHIATCVASGLAHVHRHFLIHTDVKPDNILVLGKGLPLSHSHGTFGEPADWQFFAKQLLGLPQRQRICLADLGSVVVGTFDMRPKEIADNVRKHGLRLQTLGYRSLEVCCGDVHFSYSIDAWSLGCVFAEVVLRQRLIRASSNAENISEIFRLFGTPADSAWSNLPLFPQLPPNCEGTGWRPVALLEWNGARALNFLKTCDDLFCLSPLERLSVDTASKQCSADSSFAVAVNKAAGGRGVTTIVAVRIGDTLLKWMQQDSAWEDIISASGDVLKREIGGYASEAIPKVSTCNGTDCSQPFLVPRVYGFGCAFRRKNKQWLADLSQDVRNALRMLPAEQLGLNGTHFFETCFSETAFAYAWAQIMSPAMRDDEEHFDGGASILMATLTLYGCRNLHLHSGGAWQSLPQEPGNFYVGTMASVLHRVSHDQSAGSLLHGKKIVVLFRSDCFAGSRGRVMATKPGPSQVFDIVNAIVSAKLSREPLACPTAAEAMAEWWKRGGGKASEPQEERLKRQRLSKKTRPL